jgi:hypothetical protein
MWHSENEAADRTKYNANSYEAWTVAIAAYVCQYHT